MARVLITRPEGKSQRLAGLLTSAGHQCETFPVLTLQELSPPAAALAPLADAEIVIFISQDAVRALANLEPEINPQARFFAVGDATADAISEHFDRPVTVPEQHDSEGLLALSGLHQVSGRHVVLVKGEGGRALLASTLREREAVLNSISVYRRIPAPGDAALWVSRWQELQIDSIIITSNATVDAIFRDLAANQLEWLQNCHFYVASARIAEHLTAQSVPNERISVAQGASDEAMCTCIELQGSSMKENHDTPAPSLANTQTGSALGDEPKISVPVSKTALLALLVALSGVALSAYHFKLSLDKENQVSVLQQQLQARESAVEQQLQAVRKQTSSLSQNHVLLSEQLNAQLEQQTQAWQQAIHNAIESQQNAPELNRFEVASMQRMAEFKLWSERDYQGAAAVLSRLDLLLSQFAGTGEVRQVIHQDIEMLKAQPVDDSEEIYLQLHGLTALLDDLAFNMVELPDAVDEKDAEPLSDEVSMDNLKRTWHRLVDDFIKVRERSKPIEPLLDQREQAQIRQRLAYALSNAQNAALNKQPGIYLAALQQAQEVVYNFLDKENSVSKRLMEQLEALKQRDVGLRGVPVLGTSAALKEWLQ